MGFLRTIWICMVPAIFMATVVNAQLPEASIRKFDNQYGLNTHNYKRVLQDNLGFVWIMYEHGIQRFDGKNTDEYFQDEKVYSMIEDAEGTVWTSNATGVYKFDPDEQKFTAVETKDTSDSPKVLFRIDDLPALYISDSGIFRYNRDTNTFLWIGRPNYDIKENVVLQIEHFSNVGHTLFYNIGDTIWRHDLQSGKKEAVEIQDAWQIVALSKDEIITTNWESKTWYYNFATGEKVRLTYLESDPFLIVFGAVKVKGKGIYLASSKGILAFDNRIKGLRKVRLSYDGIPLPDIRYRAIYHNKDGLIWAATENSLVCFTIISEDIYFIRNNEYDTKQQFTSAVRNFAEDEYGNLWLATRNGLTRWNIENNEFHTIEATENDNERLNHASIRGLVYDGTNLIIGQTNKGIWLYNPKQKNFKRPVFQNNDQGRLLKNKIEQDFISQIRTLKNGNHIISARDGAYLMDGSSYVITEIPFPGDDFFVRFSYEDSTGNIFLGTKDGLYCLGPDLDFKYEIKEQLDHSSAFSLLEFDNGYFFGTQKGVYFFSEKDNGVTIEKIIPELENERVQTIFSDANRQQWFVTENKLHRLEPGTNKLSTFGFTENVHGDYFYPNSYYRNKEGLVFIGGVNGINYFYPEKVSIHPEKIYPYIRHINVLGITEPITAGSSLNLGYNKSNITLGFAAPYFGNPSDLQYRYRLTEEKEWFDLGNSNNVNLSKLPPGGYKFQMAASMGDGVWHTSSDTFYFTINPPFWQAWWFIAGMILLVGIFLFRLYTSSQRKLKTEKMLNTFATSLYGQNTVDGILWDTARNCVQKLRFVDAVIYLIDDERKVLIQKAAFGTKNPYGKKIINRMEIPIGEGIVGSVAETGKPERITNTEKDPRYILDSKKARSEITVPIWVDGKVFAIIDSEHPERNFYKPYHLELLKKIAVICSERITKYLTEEQLRGKIARDLHDEMGSTLTNIHIISKMAGQDSKDNPPIQKQLNRINEHTAGIMEKMSDLVWVVNPANDSLNKVIYRIKEYAIDIMEPTGIKLIFEEMNDAKNIKINPEQRKNLYLIAKETLNNAVKYSEASKLSITFEEKKNILKMCIEDNGNGYDPNNIKLGNGIKNLTTRAEEIKAKLQIETGEDKGVFICLTLNIEKIFPD